MRRTVDDRDFSKKTKEYRKLIAGETFLHQGSLYMVTDQKVTHYIQGYLAVDLSTGKARDFHPFEIVELVTVVHHLVD